MLLSVPTFFHFPKKGGLHDLEIEYISKYQSTWYRAIEEDVFFSPFVVLVNGFTLPMYIRTPALK